MLRLNFIFFVCFFWIIEVKGQGRELSSIDYYKADSIAALYPRHSLTDLKILSVKLTLPLHNDVEKFRAIFSWVCHNITNDYGLYIRNKIKRENLKDKPIKLRTWNSSFLPVVNKKLTQKYTTVCTGYAMLIKKLAFYAGIPCTIINGYARTSQANIKGTGTANHSWNAVNLQNKWYLCDATWSSGTFDQGVFLKQFTDDFFLTSPELFVMNHYPLDTVWLLMKSKPSLQEFLNGPLIYKAAVHEKIVPIAPGIFEVRICKGDNVAFRFRKKGDEPLKNVEFQKVKDGNVISIDQEIQKDADGFYTFRHFFKDQGIHVFHFLTGGEFICTYRIVVSKQNECN